MHETDNIFSFIKKAITDNQKLKRNKERGSGEKNTKITKPRKIIIK